MEDAPQDPDIKTEWAERRTDWAEDRTVLANERTFAGWIRTGLASVAVALGLKAVFGDFQPTWIAKAVASIFLLGAVFVFWGARQKAVETVRRMDEHAVESQPTRRITLLAALFAMAAVATAAILWML